MPLKPAALLWWLSCLPEGVAYWRATRKVEPSQSRTLASILRGGAASEFGRRHALERIRHVDEFRERVPLTDYEDYREAVDRIARGEAAVLTQEPVRLLEPTSGSSGGAKLIPYTATLKAQFQRGVAAWMANLMGWRPQLMGGRHYWSISPPPPHRRTAVGLPIGFDDDAAYLSGWSGRLVRSLLAVPPQVLATRDYQRATLEHLVSCRDLVLVSVWSPTFWLLLLERLQSEWGQTDLRQLWPRLACISCWGDGFSSRYLERLRQLHPGVWIQKKGLIATEAFCTFPLVGREGGALALRSHFFEFLDTRGRSQLAHQLERGQDYQLVVTTGGGLYRYRLGDTVRVVSYWNECPLLSFQGRHGGVVDRFGEKLSPADVLSGLPAEGFAMVAYETAHTAYALLAEGRPEELEACRAALEGRLRERNFHYDHCRRLGQLQPLALYVLESGALTHYYTRLQQQGMRDGDLKPVALSPHEDWSRFLPGQFA